MYVLVEGGIDNAHLGVAGVLYVGHLPHEAGHAGEVLLLHALKLFTCLGELPLELHESITVLLDCHLMISLCRGEGEVGRERGVVGNRVEWGRGCGGERDGMGRGCDGGKEWGTEKGMCVGVGRV